MKKSVFISILIVAFLFTMLFSVAYADAGDNVLQVCVSEQMMAVFINVELNPESGFQSRHGYSGSGVIIR